MKNTNENLSKTEFKQKSNHSEVFWGIVVFLLLTDYKKFFISTVNSLIFMLAYKHKML